MGKTFFLNCGLIFIHFFKLEFDGFFRSIILPNIIIYMGVIKCLTSWTSPKAPLPITLTTSKSLCCIRQLLANSTGLASEMLKSK